jgi:hypothetical protein
MVGMVTLLNEVRFGKRAVAAGGEVIDLHDTRSGKAGGMYYPVVRFQCRDEGRWEEEMVFESSYGSRPPSHHVGDHVPVLSDPVCPERAQINTFRARWLLPWICIFAGIVASLVVWVR